MFFITSLTTAEKEAARIKVFDKSAESYNFSDKSSILPKNAPISFDSLSNYASKLNSVKNKMNSKFNYMPVEYTESHFNQSKR